MIVLPNWLPVPVLALAIVVIFVLVGLVLLFLVRKTLKALHFEAHTEFGGIFSNAIGVMFALIFAFVTIAVWQSYDRVRDVVSKEADILHDIYRTLDGYPPEIRNAGQERLKTYVHEVIDHEWPLLAKNQQDHAIPIIRAFHRLMLEYRPASLGELPIHQDMLRLLSNYRERRLDRLNGAEPILDSAMWTVLIASGLILIVFFCMFTMSNIHVHVFMVSALCASFGLIFFLLSIYNNPFAGPGGISAEPFKKLLEHWAN